MAKLVDYICDGCDETVEEIFMDTEEQPEVLEVVCPQCGELTLRRCWNIKKNSQVWKQHL
jgi:predicted RNA-binding Zn-ribbon protein involved in translation (DUF1610 family)